MFPSGKTIFGNVILVLSIDLDPSIYQPTYLEPNILAPAPLRYIGCNYISRTSVLREIFAKVGINVISQHSSVCVYTDKI